LLKYFKKILGERKYMEIMVSSAFGLEAVVKREMIKLGLENPKAIDGKVRAIGTMEDVMRLNVCLRSGDRVLIKLAEFRAVTFEELFQNVKQIPFENYIKSDAKILMDGNSVKSILGAIKVSGGVIKKSIVDRLSGYYKCELKEDG
jgi:putative N6-adenine-specific DNA methylase